ncbi:hypothetical protein [Streptomyces bobili]|uniref:hypothetical protein n=1 Tax=Streptomyces bobili TaxID=67280 RepID=UPI00379F28B3
MWTSSITHTVAAAGACRTRRRYRAADGTPTWGKEWDGTIGRDRQTADAWSAEVGGVQNAVTNPGPSIGMALSGSITIAALTSS